MSKSSTLVDEVLLPSAPTHDQTQTDQTQADRISKRSLSMDEKRNVDVAVDSFVTKQITKREMFMMVLILPLLAAISYVFLHRAQQTSDTSRGSAPGNQSPLKLEEVCLTKECVHSAARIDSSIDYKTHPCDDFYQFACGGWLKENVLPKDKSSISKYIFLHEKAERIVKDLLEEEIKDEELSSIKKAKTVFASCMNQALIKKLGLGPLKKIVREEFGGWPMATEYWNESGFDLVTTMKKLNDYRISSFFELTVRIDHRDSSQRVLTIEELHLCLPFWMSYQRGRQFQHLKSYESDIYKIGSLFGLSNETSAADDVKSIVDFEYELANIWFANPRERKSIIMTLDDLQTNYSQAFNWTMYVTSILSSPEIEVTDVTGNYVIMNFYPRYLQKLAEFINKTPTRTLANYLVWKFIDMCLYEGLVGGNVVQVYKYKSSKQDIFHEELSKQCLDYTTNVLGQAVGRMFVRETFDDETRELISNIIIRLQAVYDEMFENLDWMDDATKVIAKEKNAFIKSTIGYQAELDNDTYVDSLYSHLAFNKDTFLENVLTIKKEKVYTEFRKLRTPVEHDKWMMSPQEIGSVNIRQKNHMVIPAGALLSPLFNKKEPRSLIFGAVGNIVAHEIAHGFDDIGSEFDKFGNKFSWWPSGVAEKFRQRAQCLVDQYGNFTDDNNMNLDGERTMGENLADNVALKQSYKAYRHWVDSDGKEEPSLPSLTFTHNQLYFVSYAQIWCEKETAGAVELFSPVAPHSPGKFRVNGPVQNSREFAEAFQCPVGSRMNPADNKCNFW